MSIDERDYYYDSKKFRAGRSQSNEMPEANDDEYWRRISIQQQEQKRNLIIFGVGLIALIWFFGAEISNFFKSLSWTRIKNGQEISQAHPILPPNPISSELSFPESGSTIKYQQSGGDNATFNVISAQGRTENCVVKLEAWNGGIPIIEVFVRVGEQAETKEVPLGDYRAKIACGKRWFGRNEMFGRGTIISIGEMPLKFSRTGDTTFGNTLTLTKEINGNFKTRDFYFDKF